MKTLLVVSFILICIDITVYSQNSGNWKVQFNTGIEQHDKRLFDYSEKETLLVMQPEFFGTYHIGINLNRKVWQDYKFTSFVGLGLGYEEATFLRPFNHFYLKEDNFLILRNLNRYGKVQLLISFGVIYELTNQWTISGGLKSYYIVNRIINHTENNSSVFPYTKTTFELDELHLELGLRYRIGHFLIGMNSRILNYQKIDKIIFNQIIHDPRSDQKWEWYNPLRFDFTIGYVF